MTSLRIGEYRANDIHTPRTQSRKQANMAWEGRERGFPRPYWHDVAAGVGLIIIILTLLAIGRFVG